MRLLFGEVRVVQELGAASGWFVPPKVYPGPRSRHCYGSITLIDPNGLELFVTAGKRK
jgi:hypothetical protein